jgi:polar amino acid transport system substrate-binding protein
MLGLIRTPFFIAICAIFLNGCGCDRGGSRGPIKIGIDSNWSPLVFGAQNSYVNGFTEELLLDVARQSALEFERIPASWDNLFEGMKQGQYQAVLSSLPPYEFNTALYDFSHNFLDIGPVLIVPEGAHKTDLEKMSGEHIGVIAGDPAVLILQKYELIVRNYPSVADLLNALANGEIEGALLNRVLAGSYVSDIFAGRLKIAGPPLNDAGLHLIVMKGKQPFLVSQFNKSLDLLKKKKRFQALLRKWQLGEMP